MSVQSGIVMRREPCASGRRARGVVALAACAALAGCERSSGTGSSTESPDVAVQRAARQSDDAGADARAADGARAVARVDAGVRRAARRWVTETLQLRSAPFADHPEVLVHAPHELASRERVHVVLFLHGWNGCVGVVAGAENAPCTPGGPVRYAMDVVNQFERAHVPALLVLPQLAFDRESSAPGRLGERNGLRALLSEVLAHPALLPALGRARAVGDIGRMVVVPHSGAYVHTRYVLERGGVDVHEVLLLDALYHDTPAFESWARAHEDGFLPGAAVPRRFAVIYSDREGTGPRSRALVALFDSVLRNPRGVRRAWNNATLTPPPPEAFAMPLFGQRTAVSHEDIPRVFLAPLLEAAQLQ